MNKVHMYADVNNCLKQSHICHHHADWCHRDWECCHRDDCRSRNAMKSTCGWGMSRWWHNMTLTIWHMLTWMSQVTRPEYGREKNTSGQTMFTRDISVIILW